MLCEKYEFNTEFFILNLLKGYEKFEITFGTYTGPSDEELKPKNFFKRPYYDFCEELEYVGTFTKIIPKMTSDFFNIQKEQLNKKILLLDDEGKKEFVRYKKWHEMIAKQKKFDKDQKLTITHKKLAKILNLRDEKFIHESQFGWFFRKMCIVYLVSNFNEFLKNIISYTFLGYPELVKNRIELDFKELFETSEISELQMDKSSIQSEFIIHQGIDGINKNFKKIFKLNLSKKKDWNSFRDIFYRRNIIIHNQGFVNKLYLERMKKSEEDVDIRITEQYLVNSLVLFEKYSNHIWKFFNKKYLSKIKIEK